jgi:hypothetical protein
MDYLLFPSYFNFILSYKLLKYILLSQTLSLDCETLKLIENLLSQIEARHFIFGNKLSCEV